jgi:hypothetical protein
LLSDTLALEALMDAPTSEHPLFQWNPKARRYQYKESGKFVPVAAFQKLTTDHIARKKSDLRKIGEKFAEKGGFVAFQKDGWQTIKTTFTQQYLLGRGGAGRMQDSDYATLKKELRYQGKMWKGFATDIKAGTVSPAQLQQRIAMYGEASKVAYWDGWTAAAIAGGMTEERNILGIAENCPGCIERTNMGWQPFGVMGRITKDTPCRIYCYCGRECREGTGQTDAIRMDKPCGRSYIKNEFECRKDPIQASYQELIKKGEQILSRYGNVMKQAVDAFDELDAISSKAKEGEGDIESLTAQLLEAKKKAKQSFNDVNLFRDSLLSRSQATEKDIDDFFDDLKITKSAKQELFDGDLSGENLSTAIEEVLLMSNGRINPGLLMDTGDVGLASAAIDINSRTMYVDKNSEKEDVFHELGHLLEADNPGIQKAAYEFLLSRATGDKTSLSNFTGIKGHKATKVYPDHFIDPYVGLIYPGTKDTELTSVGLQHFSNAYNMAFLYKQDPEHFHFILGALNA